MACSIIGISVCSSEKGENKSAPICEVSLRFWKYRAGMALGRSDPVPSASAVRKRTRRGLRADVEDYGLGATEGGERWPR
jgi:hypothetical protein